MSVLKGVSPKSWEEAVALALREARVEGTDADVVGFFRWAVSLEELENAMRTVVGRAVRAKYGKKSEWSLQRGWYVPIARLSYRRDGVAHLTAKVDIHLVVNARLQDGDYTYSACVVARARRLQTALLPIPLLWAVIEKDLDRFRVMAKDGPCTTREVPGVGQVVLHDEFLLGLAVALARQPNESVRTREASHE